MSFLNKLFGKKSETESTSPKSTKLNSLLVSNVRRLNGDAVEISFNLDEDQKKAFAYKPGQYLTLETDIDGKKVRRPYSMCSSPDVDSEISVGIRKVEDGVFSSHANEKIKAGDTLMALQPDGKFVLTPDAANRKHYAFFAAGSGITPIFSQLKSVLAIESYSIVTLYYVNKTRNSAMFLQELENLSKEHKNFELHCFFTQEDTSDGFYHGRIDTTKIALIFKNYPELLEADDFFICGPKAMIDTVSNYLKNLRVNESRIHFELFTPIAEKTPKSKGSSHIKSKISLTCEGQQFEFEMSESGTSILDAALDAGADAPYSCRGAVCCTCRAKVLAGEVEMTMNYALDSEEVEQGFVLTCQAHPKSEHVVISYDQMT